MAKISDNDRYNYFEKIKPYQSAIDSILRQEQKTVSLIERSGAGSAYKRFGLSDEMLNLASNYLVLNGVSLAVLKVKNEDALNDARKSLYKGVIYLEQIVSNYVDAPFADYEEKLAALESVDTARRYLLIKKMGLTLQLLENAYGHNTKWRWAFVELEGRYAAVTKNIVNLRRALIASDPRSPDYEPMMYHLQLVKELLMRAANRYRERYELSSDRVDDFKQGIAFLSSLKRIYILLGEPDNAAAVKKKLDIWTLKLETDQKRQEELFVVTTIKNE